MWMYGYTHIHTYAPPPSLTLAYPPFALPTFLTLLSFYRFVCCVSKVGPGTGLAPLRGFLLDREASGAKGDAVLFFGCRYDRVYLYMIWRERSDSEKGGGEADS